MKRLLLIVPILVLVACDSTSSPASGIHRASNNPRIYEGIEIVDDDNGVAHTVATFNVLFSRVNLEGAIKEKVRVFNEDGTTTADFRSIVCMHNDLHKHKIYNDCMDELYEEVRDQREYRKRWR